MCVRWVFPTSLGTHEATVTNAEGTCIENNLRGGRRLVLIMTKGTCPEEVSYVTQDDFVKTYQSTSTQLHRPRAKLEHDTWYTA